MRCHLFESGEVDAAVIDMAFSKKLEQRRFNVLGDWRLDEAAQKFDRLSGHEVCSL
jgi:hypothetical protein